MRPRFSSWLLSQSHRDDPVGDLARDAKRDRANWGRQGKPSLDRRVQDMGCSEARRALREARAEWRARYLPTMSE